MGGRTSRYAQKRWDHAQPGQSQSGSSRDPRPTGTLGLSLHHLVFPRPLLTCHALTEISSQYPFKTRTWHSGPLTLFHVALLKYEVCVLGGGSVGVGMGVCVGGC